MIDRASGYVDPDEDIQLEEEEVQDEQEEEIEPEEDNPEVIHSRKCCMTHFQRFLVGTLRMLLQLTYCSFNNQCEY